MKVKIRRGIWESNSSSSHSICITKNSHFLKEEDFEEHPEYMYINKKGILDLSYHEEDFNFERHPFRFLCTFKDKLIFAIASLCGGYEPQDDCKKTFAKILEISQKINPKIKGIKLPRKFVRTWIDEKGEIIPDSTVHYDYENQTHYYIKDGHMWNVHESGYYTEEPYYGYVDHQSMGLLQSFLEKENVSLEDFLGNKKYVVIITGDEYDDWDCFKYSGILNLDNIEKEFGI